jgi:XTP/dITP diphosphohydrolase
MRSAKSEADMEDEVSGRVLERLVIATHNEGKLREIRQLLAPFGISAASAGELGLAEPDETGASFVDNAILKAGAAARATDLPALADDSGLCVEALDGAPGIYSARWAGESKDFAAAMARIDAALRARGCLDPAHRRAWFISTLALAWPDESFQTFEGRVDGVLVWPPRGNLGFGYDAMFLPDGSDRTFGEMTSEEKHGLPADDSPGSSHRARAFQALRRAILPPR